LETWPHATHDVEFPALKITRERELVWTAILEFVCETGGRVFMDKEDALSLFAWQDRNGSGRVSPWLARLDALLSTFGVHSRLTGSTLYSSMVFKPENPPLLGEPSEDYRAWWVPKQEKKPGQKAKAKAKVSVVLVGDSVAIPKGTPDVVSNFSKTVASFRGKVKGGAKAHQLIKPDRGRFEGALRGE
jgi:hypothetical protein